MAENLFRDFEGAEIWQHFKRSKCGKLSECKICKKIIKCDGGSTKGLLVHLKTIHQIEILKRTSSETISKPKVNITGKLDLFINDASLSAVLARMTACDGLSFNIFVTSFDLRKSLSALGHSLPKSVNGIKAQVMKYGDNLRQRVTRCLQTSKSKNEKFSLTFDEWTSVQNKRYININIHGREFFWNLGLVRIRGKFSAEKCCEVISEKLNEFGLKLRSDIVAITTDGCAMMRKLGRIIPPFQQLCYAHGLQLAIQDVFYVQSCNTEELTYHSDVIETDEDEELELLNNDDEIDGLIVLDSSQDNTNCLSSNILGLVNKVRKIVKIFRRSPLKNEILQRYVKEVYPNGLNLILDCKTRWSSLLDMLERIVRIKVPVQKALLDLQEMPNLSNQEFTDISIIIFSLSPIKAAIEALCRRDANLIVAEATIKFLLEELQSSPSYFNEKVKKAIEQRIVQERYIDASIILQCLHNPQAHLEKRGVVIKFCNDLLSRLIPKVEDEDQVLEDIDNNLDSSISESPDPENLSVTKKLQLAIDASLQISNRNHYEKKTLSSILRHELTVAEETGKRGHFLEMVYQVLLNVPPTSVEAERVFSSSAYLCNKFRSRLSDTTLDTLCFIRSNQTRINDK